MSVAEARASVGRTSPLPAERRVVWSRLVIPSAGVDGYEPHPYLARIFDHPARMKLIAGGIRAGKSLASAVEAICWAPHSDLIWIAADTYDLTRQEFEYIAEGLISLAWTESALVSMPRQRYMPCALDTYWGCRIESRSLRDVESFVARAPDLIVFCEPGQASGLAVEKAIERLSTRRGHLWMAGTFEQLSEQGQWMEDLWRRWSRWPNPEEGKSFTLPTWLNTHSFPGGKRDPEIQRLRSTYGTERDYLLRLAGVPVPASSLVVGQHWDPRRHIREDACFVPAWGGAPLPVELAIDPGYSGGSHYAVLAFQYRENVHCLIDEVIAQTLVHEEVIAMCRQRPWWTHVIGGVIDPYAGGSHVYGAQSPLDIWSRETGMRFRLAPRVEVEDLVNRLASTLDSGSIAVHPNVRRFVWEMTHWRRRRLPGSAGYGPPSKHNCDALKAAGYYLLDSHIRRALGYTEEIKTEEFVFA